MDKWETFLLTGTYLIQTLTKTIIFQTCEIKAEGGKRFLTLHKVKLDQAGEVLYQALNAFTTAILTVKGTYGLIEYVGRTRLHFTAPCILETSFLTFDFQKSNLTLLCP